MLIDIAVDVVDSIELVGTSESRRMVVVPVPVPVIFSRLISVPGRQRGIARPTAAARSARCVTFSETVWPSIETTS